MRDMTEGNITGQIILFSLPIILGNIFQQLYNTADAIIVSRMIGKNAFAAVSVANPIMSVVLFFLVGMSLGVGVLIAQFFGAKDIDQLRQEFSTALIAGVGFTVAASLICIFLSGILLTAVHTPQEIFHDTDVYLRIIFAGLIFSFLYNYLAASLRAIGDSKTAFVFLVISSLTNVVLDIVLIRFTTLGVAAAAIATVIAQALSVVLCFLYIYAKIPVLALGSRDFIFRPDLLYRSVVFGAAAAIQQTFLYFGRLLIQGTVNAHGTDMITGYNAAIRIEQFMLAFIEGTQNALATYAGQNIGAGRIDRLKKGLFATIRMNCLYTLLFDILAFLFAGNLIGLYVSPDNVEAVTIGVAYLHIMPVSYFMCSINSPSQGLFRGVGQVRTTMIATGMQILIRCLLSLILVPAYGIYGICASVIVGWSAMTVFILWNLRRYFRLLADH